METAKNRPTLDIRNLSVTYSSVQGEVKAVRNICLKVRAGEIVCLVGESGSGKSTILMAILRTLSVSGEITEGQVFFAGNNLLTLPKSALRMIRGQEIGLIPQDPKSSLNPLLTVGTHIEEILQSHLGLRGRVARERTLELLYSVGMSVPEIISQAFPHQLSGGIRQCIMIAMAIACRPQLLLADEPTTAMDAITQVKNLRLIRSLSREVGMATLLVTHNLGLCDKLYDNIAVMYSGRIVENGPCKEIFSKPGHPYTIALLQCVPHIDHDGSSKMHSIPGKLPSPTYTVEGCEFAPRCSIATIQCKNEIPPIFPVTENHIVRCWNTDRCSILLQGGVGDFK